MADEDQATPERHASWIELFFDLVVVAGVGQLAHLLSHGPSLADVGLYVLLYLAFWIAWAAFTIYGNVAGDRVRIANMLLAMLGLAVMVAAVAGVRGAHTTAFVLAYVGLRWLAGLVYGRGSIVVDWPLAQYGAGALPWLISVFVPDGARYWLWTLGIAFDLVTMLVASGTRMLDEAQRKLDRILRTRRSVPGRDVPSIRAARTDSEHLAERMGLFVIIVLGEGVIQVLTAASNATWRLPLDAAALGAFAVLTGLWTLSLLYGFAGVPGLEASTISTRHAMFLHCITTAAIAALAAGLGSAIEHANGDLPTGARWLVCGSIAVYFAISTLGGLSTGAGWSWLLGWGVPCTLAPVLLAAFGSSLRAGWPIWIVALAVGWQILYRPITSARSA